jgi:hypothetical protein
LGGAIVLLALLNGLTPYTEIKTAFGFNMYANLVTAQGQSNHYLVRRTFPLRRGYDRPVDIVISSDPGLELYRDMGYLIAYPQFQRYIAGRNVVVAFRRGDTPEFVTGIEVNSGPFWWRFLPLRAIDKQAPPRCQDTFLPAL